MNPLILGFESYLSSRVGLSKATLYQYTRAVLRLEKWLVEEKEQKLETATPELLGHFCGPVLQNSGCQRRSQGQYIAALKRFFTWAWPELGKDPENHPAKKLEYPKPPPLLPRAMALGNADKILSQQNLETFEGVRDTAMLMLLIGCGLRVSELVQLNEEDLVFTPDPEGGFDFLDFRVVGKGKRERIVSAPKDACAAVRAYLGHPDLKRIDRVLPSGEKVLFVSFRANVPAAEYIGEKRRFNRHSVYRMLQAYGKRAKIPIKELHPHALRHLFATHLLEKGVDLYSIQDLLGHVSVASTQIYLRMAPGRKRAIVNQKTPLSSINTPFRKLVNRSESKRQN